ncbi:MAG: extracellular solute-binding protein, partial [bacterium]
MRWNFLLLAFCISPFLSCRGNRAKLTIAVGGAPNEVEYWERIVREFTDSTSIEVILLRQPTDTDQRRQGLIIPLRAGKNDPDVFIMDVIWVAQFAASDWLLPLTERLGRGDLTTDQFLRSIIQNVDTYRGEVVALPVYNDCGLLYYRKDLLQKYNLDPPVTWAE